MLTTRTKIALARLIQRPLMLVRRLFGRGPQTIVRRRGVRWRLDLREGIDLSIYLLRAFEPATLKTFERLVKPGMTVLDIGANIGAHTLHFARLVGAHGHVHAFEPTDWAMAKLNANLDLNPDLAARVDAVQAFLVDAPDRAVQETVHASWPVDGAGVHAKLRARALSANGARAVVLDEYLDEKKVGTVDLIKIDVDGYECQVLSGARALLKKHAPPLVMELSPYILEERGASIDQLLDILSDAGYRLEHLDSGRPLPEDRAEIAGLYPDGAGGNVLARPRGVV